MIISGWDIASYKSGYFFLDTDSVNYKIGLIDVNGNQYERIRKIGEKSKILLDKYEPDIIIIESTYLDDWRKHKKGSKKRGSVDTLKILEKCHGAFIANTSIYQDIFYMSPNEHKEALTGMGHAGKKATIWQIQKKLNLVDIDDNMSDAAALVFTWLIKKEQWNILEEIKKKYE